MKLKLKNPMNFKLKYTDTYRWHKDKNYIKRYWVWYSLSASVDGHPQRVMDFNNFKKFVERYDSERVKKL